MRPDLIEIGSTGLNRVGGYIQEDINAALRGSAWEKNVVEMTEQDAIVGAMLFAIEMLMRGVEWQIMPSVEDDSAALEWSDFVKSCMDDMSMSWSDILSEILTMLPWGFAPMEVVYKVRGGEHKDHRRSSKFNDGRFGWRKWSIRGQETIEQWLFDEDGGIQGMIQLAPPRNTRVEIPIEKTLLFRTKARQNNPEGRSVLRNAYVSWYYKNNIQRIEAIGIERDFTGWPLARAPAAYLSSSATSEQIAVKDQILDIVTGMKRDEKEGGIFPSDRDEQGNYLFDLSLLTTGGSRVFDTDKIIARYDQRIAMTVLADFILIGHENVGSNALVVGRTDLFTSAIKAWLSSIADVINRFAIPRLMAFNGVPADLHPSLEFGDVSQISINQLCEYVSKLTGANLILPDDELEAHLRQTADLPPIPEGRERPDPQINTGALQRSIAQGYIEDAQIEAARRVLARG